MATRRTRKKGNESMMPPKKHEEPSEAFRGIFMGEEPDNKMSSEELERLLNPSPNRTDGNLNESSGLGGNNRSFSGGAFPSGGGYTGQSGMSRGGNFFSGETGEVPGGGGLFTGGSPGQRGKPRTVSIPNEGGSGMSEPETVQMFSNLEHLSVSDKEAALLAMGGPELVYQYHTSIGPALQGMKGRSAPVGLGGLHGMGGTPGMGGIPGMGGMSDMGGVPGMGGISGMGDIPGMGGVPGMGGLFGAEGRGIPGLGGGESGNLGVNGLFQKPSEQQDLSQEEKQTIEQLKKQGMSEEDVKAALEAMGKTELAQKIGKPPPRRRRRQSPPPPLPYEPTGPGMFQFHRKQPIQLPIHGRGAESRWPEEMIMPHGSQRRRFGERILVRTHGSQIDLEGYYKHLVQKFTNEAKACRSPMCNGPNTIIVLDISESMRGEPIETAKQAILDFIKGLEEIKTIHGLEENLGLLMWHGDTFDVIHLTNDYSKITEVLENIPDVDGASPLIMTLAVVEGMAERARVCQLNDHTIMTRTVIFSDFNITPPGFDPTQEEYVRDRVQVSCDENFFENTQDLIHDKHVRMFAVPCGGENAREWFSNRISHDGYGEKVLPEDAEWLCRNYICERIVAECKTRVATGLTEDVNEEYVQQKANVMYSDVNEDDIDFVIKRLKEDVKRPPLSKRQKREKRLQAQIDRADAISRGEEPPPMPEEERKKPEKPGRKSLEELLGIESDDSDEEDDEETDLLFRLPGLLGDEEDAENDPLTKQKIEELLEYYGGGPPKTDNLPIMPNIGDRVIKGPDWMWQKNDIPDNVEGTVIGIDQEDIGWVKVRWDKNPAAPNEAQKEEDYRFGVDYEFDVMPAKGGMEFVVWPEGKERKIVEPVWLQELNREKEELAKLKIKIEKEKEKERRKKEQEGEEMEQSSGKNQESSAVKPDDDWSDLASEKPKKSQVKESHVCNVWQYQAEDGSWQTYNTDIQQKLEQTYIKRDGKGTVVIEFEHHNERVVFAKMEQRRIDKKGIRQVRRIEADADRLKELQDMFSV